MAPLDVASWGDTDKIEATTVRSKSGCLFQGILGLE